MLFEFPSAKFLFLVSVTDNEANVLQKIEFILFVLFIRIENLLLLRSS